MTAIITKIKAWWTATGYPFVQKHYVGLIIFAAGFIVGKIL